MSKLKYVHNDTEYVEAMERGLDNYLGSLWEALEREEENPPILNETDETQYTDDISLTGLSFCGCDTCIQRETLAYLLPLIIDGYNAGKFELNEEYKP